MKSWLAANTIAHDGINCTEHNAEGSSAKPIADVYLDDRAVRFVGDFDFALRQVWSAERVGPWWERDGGPSPARAEGAHSAPPPGDRCAVSGGRGASVTADDGDRTWAYAMRLRNSPEFKEAARDVLALCFPDEYARLQEIERKRQR